MTTYTRQDYEQAVAEVYDAKGFVNPNDKDWIISRARELAAAQPKAGTSKEGEWYAYYDDHRHEMRIQREPIIDSESGQYIIVRRVDAQPSASEAVAWLQFDKGTNLPVDGPEKLAREEVVERECGQLFGPLFEPTKRLLRELRRQLDVIDRLSKCGSADSFMQLSDEEKRKWFAMYVSTDADLHAEIRALKAALANSPQQAGTPVRMIGNEIAITHNGSTHIMPPEQWIERASAFLREEGTRKVTDEDTRRPFAIAGDVVRDAERYRYLRQPNNCILYARVPNGWGNGTDAHVKYVTPEEYDAVIDAALESFAASHSGDEQQGRDAARYRWLKDEDKKSFVNGLPRGYSLATVSWRNLANQQCALGPNDDLDALIDAAIAAQQKEQAQRASFDPLQDGR